MKHRTSVKFRINKTFVFTTVHALPPAPATRQAVLTNKVSIKTVKMNAVAVIKATPSFNKLKVSCPHCRWEHTYKIWSP